MNIKHVKYIKFFSFIKMSETLDDFNTIYTTLGYIVPNTDGKVIFI